MTFETAKRQDQVQPVDLEACLRGLVAMVADAVIDRIESAAPVQPAHAKPGHADGPRLLLTVEEAARRLSVGRTAAYELIKSGELESVMIGRSRRVPAPALEEYVRGLSSQTT